MSMKLAAGLFVLSLSMAAGCIDHSGDAPPFDGGDAGQKEGGASSNDTADVGDSGGADQPADMAAVDGAVNDGDADGASDASGDADGASDASGDAIDGGGSETNADADADGADAG